MYGPPDGKESIEEKRIRREREKREYENGLAEFDAKRNEEVIKMFKACTSSESNQILFLKNSIAK